MKKDAKTYHEVAERCTKFCPCEKCGCSNSSDCSSKNSTNSKNTTSAKNSSSEEVSCKNCTHYNTTNVCDLDLYKEIVENHNL